VEGWVECVEEEQVRICGDLFVGYLFSMDFLHCLLDSATAATVSSLWTAQFSVSL
jgi:hypothetical protein